MPDGLSNRDVGDSLGDVYRVTPLDRDAPWRGQESSERNKEKRRGSPRPRSRSDSPVAPPEEASVLADAVSLSEAAQKLLMEQPTTSPPSGSSADSFGAEEAHGVPSESQTASSSSSGRVQFTA